MLISISEEEACEIISAYLRSKGVDMDANVRAADLTGDGTSFIFHTDIPFFSVLGEDVKKTEQDNNGIQK